MERLEARQHYIHIQIASHWFLRTGLASLAGGTDSAVHGLLALVFGLSLVFNREEGGADTY